MNYPMYCDAALRLATGDLFSLDNLLYEVVLARLTLAHLTGHKLAKLAEEQVPGVLDAERFTNLQDSLVLRHAAPWLHL